MIFDIIIHGPGMWSIIYCGWFTISWYRPLVGWIKDFSIQWGVD